jgi:hypothetical protein
MNAPMRRPAADMPAGGAANPGVLILDPSGNNTLSVTSSGNVTVTNGSIVVDSKSGSGASLSNTGNVVADTINLSGPSYSHSSSGDLIGQVNYKQRYTPDPLVNVPEPSQPPLPNLPDSTLAALGSGYSTNNGVNDSGNKGKTIDLYPGYYGASRCPATIRSSCTITRTGRRACTTSARKACRSATPAASRAAT